MYNSFQHTFHYPTLPSAASAPVAEAAAAAAAAASHIHPHPSAGMMYSHYHGHPFRFRRFGVFRRFFWVRTFSTSAGCDVPFTEFRDIVLPMTT